MRFRLLILCLTAAHVLVAQEPATFDFKADDRVVLLGTTVIEREQRYGYFESLLGVALADKQVSVRNLGWSGDTVFGDARSYFGPPAEGLTRLTAHLELIKPTVVILCYGTDLAHDGLSKLPDFLSGYRSMLELVRQKSAPEVRVIIATPPPLETLPPPLPDQSAANKNLASLRDALSKFARTQSAHFVDWFELMGGLPKAPVSQPLTENGVHYTEQGYQKLAAALVKGLGLPAVDVPNAALDPLREAVKAKDFLFFNRWRPQNETYLFGFRKHEQGQNAKEIPMFDPLIGDAEKKIAALKTAALSSVKRL
jgi:lysophospholipase L1-like esterase